MTSPRTGRRRPTPGDWDSEVDVLVASSGLGGLDSAVVAAAEARVAVAEKAASGPCRATVLGPALIDTAGGPRCDPGRRVIRPDGSVIHGLHAVSSSAAHLAARSVAAA